MIAENAPEIDNETSDPDQKKLETGGGCLLINTDLNKSTVHMKNKATAVAKLAQIMEGGAQSLMIISDFDQTISKSTKSNGERNPSMHGLFDALASEIRPDLGVKFDELRAKYYPIEHDPYLTNEQKLPHMIAWWTKAHELMVQTNMRLQSLEERMSTFDYELRDGWFEFIQLTERLGIPLIIFSAGIGDMIDICLRQKCGHVPKNIHVISNWMTFDETGVITGFRPPLIHTFNKNCSVIQGEKSYFQQLSSRHNVVLIGDTLGDLHMDVGVLNEGAILKVGYLNEQVNANLPGFMEGFDIVLREDPTFDVPLSIVRSVIATEAIR